MTLDELTAWRKHVAKPTNDEISALSESFTNGNISYVADEICGMEPGYAAYATGIIVAHYMSNRRQEDVSVLLKAILRRVEG
jgi:hypothetical protein